MTAKKQEVPSLKEQFKTLGKEFFASLKESVHTYKGKAENLKSNVEHIRENGFDTFNVVTIAEDTYRIGVGMLSNCYLLVGEEEALLIDTGIGWTGLRATVEKLTDKPVTVVVTHAVPDTVGGAGEFDEVLVAKGDLKLAKFRNKYILRKFLVLATPGKYLLHLDHDDDMVTEPGNFQVLDEEESFQLGDRKVKVVETPAHSKGAVSFKDMKTGYLFSGDVCTPVSLMVGLHAVPMKEYERSLKAVEKNVKNSRNYSTHSPRHLNNAYTYDLRQLVHRAVKRGNNPDELIDLMHSEGYRRILLYFPTRVSKDSLGDRIKDALRHD